MACVTLILYTLEHTTSKDKERASSIKILKTMINDCIKLIMGFPGGSAVKNPSANVGDMGLIPGWGRSPGEGNGNPLQ